MMMKGIDVSAFQKQIDFNAVKKAGVEFVIIRAGFGSYISQKDPYFEQNYTRAKAAGLKVGAYWFSYANSPEAAAQEARTCAEAIKGKTFEFPIYYDLENDPKSNYFPFSKGKEHCSKLVTVFCTELEKLGYFAGLYISRSPLQTHITKEVAERFALWVAEYGSKLNYNGNYGVWQNSSTGRFVGIIGNVDTDICYIDYPSIITKGGFNGYTKQQAAPAAAKPTAKPAAEPAKEPEYITYKIQKGDTLTAIARKYGTTIAKLKEINNIKNVNLIYAGDTIKIPKKA